MFIQVNLGFGATVGRSKLLAHGHRGVSVEEVWEHRERGWIRPLACAVLQQAVKDAIKAVRNRHHTQQAIDQAALFLLGEMGRKDLEFWAEAAEVDVAKIIEFGRRLHENVEDAQVPPMVVQGICVPPLAPSQGK